MLKKEKGHKFTTYGPCSVDDDKKVSHGENAGGFASAARVQ